MNLSEIAVFITALGGLIVSIYTLTLQGKQQKKQAELEDAKMKFDQGNQLMEQQRQLINTLQGLLKDRDASIQAMQSNIDNLKVRFDRYVESNAPTEAERKEATKMLKLHRKEAELNGERDLAYALKLDALKPIERERG